MAFSKEANSVRHEIPASHRAELVRRHIHFVALAAAAILICARTASTYGSAPLTSDESLYLSEAVSIAHGHLSYASGEPIVHRPPLYPATLAPAMGLTGNDIAAVRVVPLAYAIGAVAALFILARRLFGTSVAIVAALVAAVAEAPARLGGTFNVDTAATMWLLFCIAVLVGSDAGRYDMPGARLSARRGASAGVLLGLAFLTKETAALWLPAPILLALLGSFRVEARGLGAFYGAFAAIAGSWALWVAWHTHALFKLEFTPTFEVALGISGLVVFAAVGLGVQKVETRRVRLLAACLLATFTAAAALFVLESRPEPNEIDYFRSVPDWTFRVFATNVEPFPLIVASWAIVVWRVLRDEDVRFAAPLVGSILIAPLYVYVANRGWEVRQLLPLVYLSYLVLAWAIVTAATAITRRWAPIERGLFLGAIIVGVMVTAAVASGLAGGPSTVDAEPDWQYRARAEIASWLRQLPQGSSLLSSRLYSTQLYVDTDGRFEVHQLPTLAITISEDHTGPVVAGTLFRYEDGGLDRTMQRTWLYIRRYPSTSYYIGLAAEDLEQALTDPAITHVLISGEDAGFSSYSLATNFQNAAAFREVKSYDDAFIRSQLFSLDRSQPVHANLWPLAIRWEDAQMIALDAGDRGATEEFWRALAPNGVLLSGQYVTARDMAALMVDSQ